MLLLLLLLLLVVVGVVLLLFCVFENMCASWMESACELLDTNERVFVMIRGRSRNMRFLSGKK